MMSTNEQIHAALTTGEAAPEALILAAEHDVHTLMGKLKALYERIYGTIAADIHDWHFQATALKNHLATKESTNADVTPHAEASAAETRGPISAPTDDPDPASAAASVEPLDAPKA
jgi:hypothetical protein